MKGSDPVAHPAVHAWRDACRTWACREYAYAVLSPRALDCLAGLAPLVEAGAGAGYAAWALRQCRSRAEAIENHAFRP